eukprot:CAMPEP_0196719482 /NCGR_PEP_ID=MMETSP1091-20130531/2440_1 /TAXON_ID=302021 /ORGANISM="Rhodomonas sp., Strain CCMP768" /LENGTH=189 /DNA_ID=CAMNT_0042060441 /DNA_START=112 /DNA_END=681 /DNA_ORIENTATION=+
MAFQLSNPVLALSSRANSVLSRQAPKRWFSKSGLLRMSVEDNLKKAGIELPEVAAAAANYVPYMVSGKYVYVAGQLPILKGELQHLGKVPADKSIDDAYQSARLCGLNIAAQVKAACDGDLNKVKRVVKLVGFVNSGHEFTDQPKIINGASDVMVEIFGEIGRHARSAVGVNTLPLGVTTEVEAIVEIE